MHYILIYIYIHIHIYTLRYITHSVQEEPEYYLVKVEPCSFVVKTSGFVLPINQVELDALLLIVNKQTWTRYYWSNAYDTEALTKIRGHFSNQTADRQLENKLGHISYFPCESNHQHIVFSNICFSISRWTALFWIRLTMQHFFSISSSRTHARTQISRGCYNIHLAVLPHALTDDSADSLHGVIHRETQYLCPKDTWRWPQSSDP